MCRGPLLAHFIHINLSRSLFGLFNFGEEISLHGKHLTLEMIRGGQPSRLKVVVEEATQGISWEPCRAFERVP